MKKIAQLIGNTARFIGNKLSMLTWDLFEQTSLLVGSSFSVLVFQYLPEVYQIAYNFCSIESTLCQVFFNPTVSPLILSSFQAYFWFMSVILCQYVGRRAIKKIAIFLKRKLDWIRETIHAFRLHSADFYRDSFQLAMSESIVSACTMKTKINKPRGRLIIFKNEQYYEVIPMLVSAENRLNPEEDILAEAELLSRKSEQNEYEEFINLSPIRRLGTDLLEEDKKSIVKVEFDDDSDSIESEPWRKNVVGVYDIIHARHIEVAKDDRFLLEEYPKLIKEINNRFYGLFRRFENELPEEEYFNRVRQIPKKRIYHLANRQTEHLLNYVSTNSQREFQAYESMLRNYANLSLETTGEFTLLNPINFVENIQKLTKELNKLEKQANGAEKRGKILKIVIELAAVESLFHCHNKIIEEKRLLIEEDPLVMHIKMTKRFRRTAETFEEPENS